MLLTPVFTPPLDTAVGGERRTVQLVDVTVTKEGYQFGYEKLERWVEVCKRCGIVYYEISHLFSQWGASMAPKIMGIRDGRQVQLFGWETDAAGPEYGDFLHQFLRSLRGELEKLGISQNTYFHISDEPDKSQFESYKAARKLVEKDLEGYEIIDAISDYDFYNSEYSLEHINPYRCTDAAGSFPSGDPFLVYPGADGKPEESMRIMLMDEAMSDLCAMNYLESLAGRKAVLACIEPEGNEIEGFDKYPESISYLSEMRKRINAEISRCSVTEKSF